MTPEHFAQPILVADVTGPEDKKFTPSRAFAILMQQTLMRPSDGRREAYVSALASLYAAHFSPFHVPFHIEYEAMTDLERNGLLSVKSSGSAGAVVEILVN